MLNIALFGPPGAGKGTQSEILAKEFNLFYISTGDLLRKELAADTRLGREAKEIIAAGGLVSDEIIVQIIEKTITEHPNADGFLFDGFPRTYVQCYIMEGLMLKLNASLDCLISLEVDEEVSVERLLSRGKSSGRLDDNETVIRNRLKEYAEKTLPVLDFYRERGVYRPVDGNRSVEAITDDLRAILREQQAKHLFNVVIFGYPGSGRSTQASALAKSFGLEYIATGAMLDEEIKKGSALGKRVQNMYETGQLVSDEIVVPLIERRLKSARGVRGFIFTGFPRTLVQSYILDGLLQKHGSRISRVVELEVPSLELIERLDKRRSTEHCRPYDSTTTRIVNRLKEHEEKTVMVIEKYKQQHGFIKVNGLGSPEEVFNRLVDALKPGASQV